MLVAGIIGSEGKLQTASLINSILASTGKRISVVDSKNLLGLDLKRIKSYIGELEKNNINMLLLKININDVFRLPLSEMSFGVMIYTDKAEDNPNADISKYSEKMNKVFSLIADKGIAIVNVDDAELIQSLKGLKHHIVTYGFNTKASITTSSIGDSVFEDAFICCLQRTISTNSGAVIEPQEYKLNINSSRFSTHNVLAAASFALVNGVDLNNVNSVQPI